MPPEPYVRPLATSLGAARLLRCHVTVGGKLEATFDHIAQQWGRVDFLPHPITYANKETLNGRIFHCSIEGFASALQVSVHSSWRMAKLSEPPAPEGWRLLAMSHYGAEKAVTHSKVIGPVKAALGCGPYMAVELGAAPIRVNALSPAQSLPARRDIAQ
jgi:enoyl-[acyl-carrier protein] reductase I